MATKDLSPVEKIRSLQEQIQKHVEEVKTTLAKQLSVACETVSLLQELNVKDIFKDPQLSEYVHVLNIQTKEPSVVSSGGSRVPKAQLETAIVKSLEGGRKTHVEIKSFQSLVDVYRGKGVPNLFQKLDAMVKAGTLTATGEKKNRTYQLKGK